MFDEDEAQGEPASDGTWLTSYADLMTLIACFFILLVAFANFEDPTFQRRATEFGRYFRGTVLDIDDGHQDETAVAENKERLDKEQVPHQNISKPTNKKDLLTELNESSTIASVSEISEPRDVEVVFSGSAMFEPGKIDLTPEVKDSLEVMIDVIKQRRGDLIILFEGHTDDTDIKNRIYPSNWELSSARAARVLSLFESSGIPSHRLVAVGYGDTRPSYKNRTKKGSAIPFNQRLNRRVEIKVLHRKDGSNDNLGVGIFFRGKEVPSTLKKSNDSN